MAQDHPHIPLSVMLSMYGSRINSKLLFKYPFSSPHTNLQPLSSYRQLTSSTFHLNKNIRGSVSDESIESNQTIKNEKEQLGTFSDELLGHILSPGNTKVCRKKFDVKINGIRFVGFPIVLDHVGSMLSNFNILTEVEQEKGKEHSHYSSSGGKMKESTILSFSIVFVLQAVAEYSIVEKYQELALRLSLAVRFEEKCSGYLTNETRLMLSIHDEISMEPENMSGADQAYKVILKKSRFADQLRVIYNCLRDTGIVSIKINDSTNISFCLHHKVHDTALPNRNALAVSSIENSLQEIRPYHGILIFDKKEVWTSLPDDYSPSVTRLLNVYEPTKSLQRIASDADLPLPHVYCLTSHLVYWGKACIIYPLCDSNIYVLAPTAELQLNSESSLTFQSRFNLKLADVLSHFSLPLRLSEFQTPHGLFFGNDEKLIQVVFWLLQHKFLIQMHTYIHFLPSSDITEHQYGMGSKCTVGLDKDCNEKNRILSHLSRNHHATLLTVSASKSRNDLSLFVNLMKYFNGNHQIEEIMYNENLTRPEVLTLLDKFSPVLLATMREDNTTAAFCMTA